MLRARVLRPLLLLLLLLIDPAAALADGGRVVLRNDFEVDLLPVAGEYRIDVFGWEQHFDHDLLPRMMKAEVAVDGGPEADGRVLRLPACGGRARLTSIRNISRFRAEERTDDREHPSVAPGELLRIMLSTRHDDLRGGSAELGIRFASSRDPQGRPVFPSGDGGERRTLLRLEGDGAEWRAHRAEVIVPDGVVSWRLELDLDTTLSRIPGTIELDRIEVVASPRLVLRWEDPLHRVRSDSDRPLDLRSVGLATGDYSIHLRVLDGQGKECATEQLQRYVDGSHPVRIEPSAQFLEAALAGRGPELRQLRVELLDAAGSSILSRTNRFIVGEFPFEVGRGRARHGIELPLAGTDAELPGWVLPLGATPTLLVLGGEGVLEGEGRGWPSALREVPEVGRSVVAPHQEETPKSSLLRHPELWGEVQRWFLDPAPRSDEELASVVAAPDLSVGAVGPASGLHPEVPRLLRFTPDSLRTAELPGLDGRRVISALIDGTELGADPEEWAVSLFLLQTREVRDVFLRSAPESLFRAASVVEEGFEPRPALLAWSFCRGYLGGARPLPRIRRGAGLVELPFQRGERGAVALIAEGLRFERGALTFPVLRAPRAYTATGRPVPLPPVENGRLTFDPAALEMPGGAPRRFLLLEGVDLAVERTVRTLGVTAIRGGFRLSVTNGGLEAMTIEPRPVLPVGHALERRLEPLHLAPGERGEWDLLVTLPASAGLTGGETLGGELVFRRSSGETARAPISLALPIECARLEIRLEEVDERSVIVSLRNRTERPVDYHLYLEIDPSGGAARTITGEQLAARESRRYALPRAGGGEDGATLWVGITFTDDIRGFCNEVFPLSGR